MIGEKADIIFTRDNERVSVNVFLTVLRNFQRHSYFYKSYRYPLIFTPQAKSIPLGSAPKALVFFLIDALKYRKRFGWLVGHAYYGVTLPPK